MTLVRQDQILNKKLTDTCNIDNIEEVAIEQALTYASTSEVGGGATIVNDAF